MYAQTLRLRGAKAGCVVFGRVCEYLHLLHLAECSNYEPHLLRVQIVDRTVHEQNIFTTTFCYFILYFLFLIRYTLNFVILSRINFAFFPVSTNGF